MAQQKTKVWMNVKKRVAELIAECMYMTFIKLPEKNQHQSPQEQVCVCMPYITTNNVLQDGEHLPGE